MLHQYQVENVGVSIRDCWTSNSAWGKQIHSTCGRTLTENDQRLRRWVRYGGSRYSEYFYYNSVIHHWGKDRGESEKEPVLDLVRNHLSDRKTISATSSPRLGVPQGLVQGLTCV